MIEEGRKFNCEDEFGNLIECEILMSYICEDNKKMYAFYTDNSYDEEGNLNLYASRFNGEDDNGNLILEDITDEEEWNILDVALEEAKKGMNE